MRSSCHDSAIILLAVGLMLGTRLWYAMWDAEKDGDAAFEARVDDIVREIGDRGKLMVPEAVPPAPTPAPAPVPTPAPTSEQSAGAAGAAAPAPAPVLATPTPSPSMASTSRSGPATDQLALTQAPSHQGSQAVVGVDLRANAGGGETVSLQAIAAVLERQQDRMEERLAKQHEQMDQLRKEMEVKAEQHRQDMQRMRALVETERQEKEQLVREQHEALIEQLRNAQPQAASEAISEQQLEALQARLQVLADAELLTEDECCSLEDIIVDCIELQQVGTSTVAMPAVERVLKAIWISEKVCKDKTFARALKRKVLR